MTAGFTPALGHAALSGFYDPAIALLTRERTWRARLLDQVDPEQPMRMAAYNRVVCD